MVKQPVPDYSGVSGNSIRLVIFDHNYRLLFKNAPYSIYLSYLYHTAKSSQKNLHPLQYIAFKKSNVAILVAMNGMLLFHKKCIVCVSLNSVKVISYYLVIQ